jgi:hypothetical protein
VSELPPGSSSNNNFSARQDEGVEQMHGLEKPQSLDLPNPRCDEEMEIDEQEGQSGVRPDFSPDRY